MKAFGKCYSENSNTKPYKILSDCNMIRIHNHLVRKWTLNYLVKLTKWLSCILSTNLYGELDSISLYKALT